MKFKRDENGMMVVEALISFTIFVMVVAVIVYLTTLFTLHNKVQFAINSAAQELASYSYLYQALGVRTVDKKLDSDGKEYSDKITETIEQVVDTLNCVESLTAETTSTDNSSDGESTETKTETTVLSTLSAADIKSKWEKLSETGESAKKSASAVYELVSNPNDLIVGVIYMGIGSITDEIKKTFAEFAATALVGKYLKVGDIDADTYLKSMSVVDGYDGLDFSKSSVFCDNDRRFVDIVVEYTVDIPFARLLLPNSDDDDLEAGQIRIVQRATVSGWLDGDGKTLDDYGVETKW
jgi:hypothetical protein